LDHLHKSGLISGGRTWPDMKQEALLPQRAQRIHRTELVYFMTFLGRESVDGLSTTFT